MELDEKMLLKKCCEGSVEAFETIMKTHYKKVYNIAFRMLNNSEDASDMAQEAFVKIYQSIAGFKHESSLATWVYRIATNVCLDEIRKRKNRNVVSMDGYIESDESEMVKQFKANQLSVEDLFENKETQKEISELLMSLSEEHRTMIVLRDYNGMNYEEIAKITNSTLGTVKSRLSRARNALKNLFIKSKELN